MDFLKSAVASAMAKGSSLPFSLGDRVDIDSSLWTLHNATKRDDGSNCTVFTFDINANKSRLSLAKNAMRKFRTLRHPGVLRVIDTIETESHIYIVTERVMPLSWIVKRKSINEETAKWGLYTVASTLKFINADASSVHGAIRVSSIYTSESGEWRLGGFDILSSMNDDDAVIYTYGSLVPDSARYAPPEINKGGWEIIKRNPLAAVDSYGLGILVYEVFNGNFTSPDQVGKTTNIPPSMHQSYRRLCAANPKLRLSAANFVEQGKKIGGFFETPLIRLTDDIESLGLKDDAEREEFLNELDAISEDFPEDFFKMKILPELLKSVEFGGGGPKALTAVVKIGTKLTDDEYSSRLTPVIVRLFANPDRAMRVSLLDNLPLIIDRLPQKLVTDKIFPQMTSGFTDVAPVVREQTVKAVLTVIGKLSDRVINGELLRFLARTANDEQPGIRTNTTICLGKIAKNLSPGTRSKVLIAAFSRSVRDPFVHARNAGLLAFAATIDSFSEDDCASKIMPALCPALLDKEKLIRDQANKTLDLYLQRVRKHGSTMADTVLPPPNTVDPASTNNPNAARIGTSNDTSWAGWAISSFTNKLTAAKGEIEPTSTLTTTELTRPSSVPQPSITPSMTEPARHAASTLRAEAPALARATSDTAAQTTTDTLKPLDDDDGDWGADAWDQGDETATKADEDQFFDAGSSPAPTSPATTSISAAVPYDDGGEPDFAGWLAAQSKAKAKKPLPKGLGDSKMSTAKQQVPIRSAPVSRSASSRPSPKPAKVIDTTPKDEGEEDGWGDAW
ncbi:protein kinase family protein [Talaromyces stipitatus ATCC 10500]|uniref:Protein kinase family protein n=1 Tax=Talaromyces stipitatus (strain ATCC 10500 / CBS 375.48 / QM 6759 / NRRL 1006) TaxID=441959 RepID=B8LVI4_TALSN|nr:protein kinase family protein [Talaromyces stipitatus ATCC 10500]EED24003.1 protein kinase family protein [Talaromyces stipitatus ATCC 10500]